MSRDSYLKRKYNITEKDYDQMLAEQRGVCKICGQPPKPGGPRLHVDHNHAIPKMKLTVKKVGKAWVAKTNYDPDWPNIYVDETAATRSAAVAAIRARLLRMSVRGLLTWQCNALLGKARDNPVIFQAAADYLNEFNGRYQ